MLRVIEQQIDFLKIAKYLMFRNIKDANDKIRKIKRQNKDGSFE